MAEGLTGAGLVEALKTGAFERAGVVLVGMVKPADSDDRVSFARAAATPGSTCRRR